MFDCSASQMICSLFLAHFCLVLYALIIIIADSCLEVEGSLMSGVFQYFYVWDSTLTDLFCLSSENFIF
jgi:hypothetical protein